MADPRLRYKVLPSSADEPGMLTESRRQRLLLACSLGAAFTVVAGAGVVRMRADASWQHMLQVGQELQQQVEARDPRRMVLWGEATAGNAFDHYERANELSKGLSKNDHGALVATLRMTDEQVLADTGALRERWRPALDAMRAGARCDRAVSPPYVSDDPQAGIPNLLACRWIVNMAMLEARVERLAGRTQAAVGWTLDAATFAGDTVRRGPLIRQMIGVALVAIVTEAWKEPALQDLDAPALDLLADGLTRLDEQLPHQLAYEDELLLMVHFLELAPEESVGLGPLTAWRYGFSTRWMTAAAFAHFADTVLGIDDGTHTDAGEDWHARKTRREAAFDRLAQSDNPASAAMAPNLAAAEQNLREVIAQVRLLRTSVELRRGRAAPGLADPCGDGPLAVTREGDGWRVRSAAHRPGRSMERLVPAR